jgi:hypothetical protein
MKESLGEIESCPGAPCPFWESEGCGLEHVDLRGRPELAEFLLSLRGELESLRATQDASAARRLFFERLNAGRSD